MFIIKGRECKEKLKQSVGGTNLLKIFHDSITKLLGISTYEPFDG